MSSGDDDDGNGDDDDYGSEYGTMIKFTWESFKNLIHSHFPLKAFT